MKKLLPIGLALLIAVVLVPAIGAQEKTEKKDCDKSACAGKDATAKVADKKECASSKGVARVADDKKQGCGSKKSTAAVVRVADHVTVAGEVVHCKDTMATVAEKNGMCPTGTPASGKSILVKADDGTIYLVTAEQKLNLCNSVTKVRASGKLNGTNIAVATLESWSEKEGWQKVSLEKESGLE